MMKRETRQLLRAVIALVEVDLLELRDAVVEIDHRTGDASRAVQALHDRLDGIEGRLQAIESRGEF